MELLSLLKVCRSKPQRDYYYSFDIKVLDIYIEVIDCTGTTLLLDKQNNHFFSYGDYWVFRPFSKRGENIELKRGTNSKMVNLPSNDKFITNRMAVLERNLSFELNISACLLTFWTTFPVLPFKNVLLL